jgi:hypothetical protein
MLETSRQVLLAVHDVEKMKKHMTPDVPLYVLMQWPEHGTGFIHVVGNQRIRPQHYGP